MAKKSSNIASRFALFCDHAVISSDGKLSIIGEFNQIYSSTETPGLYKGFLVASLQGDRDQKAQIEVEFIDSEKKDILPKRTFDIDFGASSSANILIEIAGLSFPHFGDFKAQFLHGGDVISQAPLKVLKVHQNVPAQA
jgi:hypothetical protein